MELRTYLSFSQVMVASLVLIFSHSGYQWHLTTWPTCEISLLS